ncbi:methyl-accepting chemotaxis protein [Reinekea blandensis]|uniref:Probable methyl-accepting chemotaxis protein n=1 Tax=Reinekea blandensis MED297 TaxID=314283 RepID=A4BJG5_9GAMM|nr:methyl-accepting chemotaxis protein [Reinekea blandensis]EAR07737.1 probable methyl-accepting chemotaxis protein [Reinekea sp. MED297] [Reinekea blandensis MED297]
MNQLNNALSARILIVGTGPALLLVILNLALAGSGSATVLNLIVLAVAAGASLWLAKTTVNALGESPGQLRSWLHQLVKGDTEFELSHIPVSGSLAEALCQVRDQMRESEEKARFNFRIRKAVDTTSTNIMIADDARNIVYMNQSVTEMMQKSESDIRQDLPNFSAREILGGSMDRFHKNPGHQMGMLDRLTDLYETEIEVGGLTFRLRATPIFDETNNERLGTVVEWYDRSEEIKAEQLARENVRIRKAVDTTSTNIMIADDKRNIVYMNESVTEMMLKSENDIRRDLPNFSANDILGGSMDRFHKNPSHQMGMLDRLTDLYETEIEVGGLTFRLRATPIVDETNNERLGTVVEWYDRSEEIKAEQLARENVRIRKAVDTTSTNIMIADAERNIVYMNQSVTDMMQNSETDIRRDLPNFSANNILGGSMDRFHKNPSHQMSMLDRLTNIHETEITVGGRTFSLRATPIFLEEGSRERLGTVVEWKDRTDEVATEREVTQLVEGAVNGDFKQSIATEGKQGFLLTLAENLNTLVSTADQSLSRVSEALERLSKGDLTVRITEDYEGAFGDLRDYCNQTAQSLDSMVTQVSEAVVAIRTASGEIAQGNSDLSSRTEQQAANLEETASSMEELSSTVKSNSDNAQQANSLAERATDVAVRGGDLIREVVQTMEAINDSSRKISDIIGVIDGIAFQTNILALNAAVEAARAGEQGRGFAVVASEVRSLAQRSANAAKDIKGLISDSVDKIESGNQLVNQSGETMDEIVGAIKRVNDIMGEIAAASTEQTSGIQEVTTAVNQMDEMTQQNAALVEETAAASENLQSQAETLGQNIDVFKLSDTSTIHAAQVGAKPPVKSESVPQPTKSRVPLPQAEADADDDDEWESF